MSSILLALTAAATMIAAAEIPGGVACSPSVEVQTLAEKRLASLCERLMQYALGPNFDKAKDAAEALASIASPVAVPYLKEVLDADVSVSYFVVSGLVRINTPETVRILIDSFDKVSVFTRMRIRDCLYQMKPQIDDPELRRRLDSILAWAPQLVGVDDAE